MAAGCDGAADVRAWATQVMRFEENYGRPDLPVWIERTAIGSSVNALLLCLKELAIEGEIAGRVLTRMAEVLEGRHTDDEIADADVTQWRDLTSESAEGAKRRVKQHSSFCPDGRAGRATALLAHAYRRLSDQVRAVGRRRARVQVGG